MLNISVSGVEELSGSFLTDGEGNLTYPLVGKLPVAGRTPDEAAQLIADSLRGPYVRDPQVRVIPRDLPEMSISIGGEVEKPGTYPATGRLTLLRAINSAGGLGDYAKYDDVLIMRTVDGQNYIGLYNIGAIQRGNYPDPELYADDIVMVGDSPARRRLDNIISIGLPLLSSTAVILNQVLR
jgi:polysaccharide export outer membrane protein